MLADLDLVSPRIMAQADGTLLAIPLAAISLGSPGPWGSRAFQILSIQTTVARVCCQTEH